MKASQQEFYRFGDSEAYGKNFGKCCEVLEQDAGQNHDYNYALTVVKQAIEDKFVDGYGFLYELYHEYPDNQNSKLAQEYLLKGIELGSVYCMNERIAQLSGGDDVCGVTRDIKAAFEMLEKTIKAHNYFGAMFFMDETYIIQYYMYKACRWKECNPFKKRIKMIQGSFKAYRNAITDEIKKQMRKKFILSCWPFALLFIIFIVMCTL